MARHRYPPILTVLTLCLTLLAARGLAGEAVAPDIQATASRGPASPASAAQGPELGSVPEEITFTYTLPDGELHPAAHTITPANVGGTTPLSWQVTTSDAWLTAAPSMGTTPEAFDVHPEGFEISPGATHTGCLSVTVTFPMDVAGSPRTTEVSLRVLDEMSNTVHLPLMANGFSAPVAPRVPNDAHINQWALETVMAPLAWGYSTGEGTVIAVIDSGIDTDHPDLAPKLWVNGGETPDNGIDDDGNGYVDDVNGWRFVQGGDGPNVSDDHGHGTHVAGIAAAATDNGEGIAGLGWDAQIQVIKALNSDGDGWLTDIVDAIYYAADNRADVINLSLGLEEASECPALLQGAVNQARAAGAVVVAAAGNTAMGAPETYPANCAGVLGVAATDRYDLRAPYSNSGAHISVAAPGGTIGCPTCEIYSTAWSGDLNWRCWGRDYCYKSGTSMATPHVAGLAALLAARYPGYTPDQVSSAILDNAVDLGTEGWDADFGCGRIDAYAAMANGAAGPEPICLAPATQSAAEGDARAARDETRQPAFAPGEIIVALEPAVGASATLARYGVALEPLPRLDAWRLRVPQGREEATLARLRRDPAVRYAHLNHLVFAQ